MKIKEIFWSSVATSGVGAGFGTKICETQKETEETFILELSEFELQTLAILAGRVEGQGKRLDFCEELYRIAREIGIINLLQDSLFSEGTIKFVEPSND
jgi:hypothetical protein